MGRKHRGNLNYQMNKFFNSILRLGESRHKAKQEFRAEARARGKDCNPSQSLYIHSKGTMQTYRQWSKDFTEYIKETTDIKSRDEIKREHLEDYVKDKITHLEETRGKASPHTTATVCSALNKIFSDKDWKPLTKKEFGVANRSYKTVKRSRNSKYQTVPEKWQEGATVSRCFGLRREGVEQIKESNIYRDKISGSVKIRVIEKGGRYREAECIKSKEAVVEEIMENRGYQIPTEESRSKQEHQKRYKDDNRGPMYRGYNRNIDNHAFRREYAQEKYKEVVERMQDEKRELTPCYRGEYYEEVLKEVSENLGHSRISVVVYSYLR